MEGEAWDLHVRDLCEEKIGTWERLPAWHKALLLDKVKDYKSRFTAFMLAWQNGNSPRRAVEFVLACTPNMNAGAIATVRSFERAVENPDGTPGPRYYAWSEIPTYDVQTGRVLPASTGTRYPMRGQQTIGRALRGNGQAPGVVPANQMTDGGVTLGMQAELVQNAMTKIGYTEDRCARVNSALRILPPMPILDVPKYMDHYAFYQYLIEESQKRRRNGNPSFLKSMMYEAILFPKDYKIFNLRQLECVKYEIGKMDQVLYAYKTNLALIENDIRNTYEMFDMTGEPLSEDFQALIRKRSHDIAIAMCFVDTTEEDIERWKFRSMYDAFN